jgi:hypothetical protein
MVGYRHDGLAGLAFPENFHTVPAALCALSGVDALANLVVELQHCEGWTVRARMSKSALMRCDDPVVVTFENLRSSCGWTSYSVRWGLMVAGIMTMTICVVSERLNAVQGLSGRPPIPRQPWRHRRTDHFDAELVVTGADAGFSGADDSESGP